MIRRDEGDDSAEMLGFWREFERQMAVYLAAYAETESLAARNVAGANLTGVAPKQVDEAAREMFERGA